MRLIETHETYPIRNELFPSFDEKENRHNVKSANMEHVDVQFSFYALLSVYNRVKYLKSRRK